MSKRSEDALIALRRIQRVTELASKRLARTAGLNPSQLSVLRILTEYPEVSAGYLAQATQLKHATITSLIDKLEARGLISRRRCDEDKRRVWLRLLPAGKDAALAAKLRTRCTKHFQSASTPCPTGSKSMLIASLEHVTSLLDAENLEAAPGSRCGRARQTSRFRKTEHHAVAFATARLGRYTPYLSPHGRLARGRKRRVFARHWSGGTVPLGPTPP